MKTTMRANATHVFLTAATHVLLTVAAHVPLTVAAHVPPTVATHVHPTVARGTPGGGYGTFNDPARVAGRRRQTVSW